MKILNAEFVTSAAAGGGVEGFPRDGHPQIALAGRSNVGKSSLINALCRKTIARTSAAPGKTRLANVYRVTLEGGAGPGRWELYLVDLPGYGYARGGEDSAAELQAVAEAYFRDRDPGSGARRSTGSKRPDRVEARGSAERADREPEPGTRSTDRGLRQAPRQTRAVLLCVDARHPGLESDRRAARWLATLGLSLHIVATKVDKLSRAERMRNLRTLADVFGTAALPVSATSGDGLEELWQLIVRLGRTMTEEQR